MPAYNPPVNAVAFITYRSLQDMANPGSYKAAPTLAAGDVKVSIDGGAFANLATLPTVTPAAGIAVKISLSAGEMTGDNIFVQFIDQTNPKEWADEAFNIQTVAGDAFTRLGAPVGASISADVAAVKAETATILGDTNDIQTRLPAALVGGRMDSSVGAMAADVLTAAATAAGFGTEIAAAVWDALLTGITTGGSIGKLLKDNIDAAISSRLASGSYTAPPTVGQIEDAVWDAGIVDHLNAGSMGNWLTQELALECGELLLEITRAAHNNTGTVGEAINRLDAAVSSRLATAGYTAPPSVGAIADQVWDEATSGHLAAGTFGRYEQIEGMQDYADWAALTLLNTAINAHVNSGTIGWYFNHWAGHIFAVKNAGTADSGTTTTLIDAGVLTETDVDYWKGDYILFTSGNISGQARLITAFDPVTHQLTFTPPTTQAVSNQEYDILPGYSSILAGLTHTGARIPNVTLADTVTTYTGNTPQTGDSFARLGAPAGASISADIAALNNLSAAQVNAEVVDALNVDTYAEPGQEVPGATISLVKKVGYMYKAFRNKFTQDATGSKLYADDGSTVDQKATVSDDGTTFTRGEFGSGP